MFNRLSSIVQNAIDTIAPPCPALEDMHYHWNAVLQVYIQKEESNCVIESTKIPYHLDQVVTQLVSELAEGECGPCMEYVFQNNLLSILAKLAHVDKPLGMRQKCLVVVTHLLSVCNESFVMHVKVNQPIKTLIGLCGVVCGSPYELQEVEFISILCKKIKQDPKLVSCLVRVKELQQSKKPTLDKTESNNSEAESSTDNKLNVELPLLSALFTLSTSPDAIVSLTSKKNLFEILKSNQQMVKMCSVKSGLTLSLIRQVSRAFYTVPKDIDFAHIEDLHVSWSFPTSPSDVESTRSVENYLLWFDLIDDLISYSCSEFSNQLAVHMQEQYFVNILEPMLISVNSSDSLVATLHLIKIIREIKSTDLINKVGIWLLGENRSPDKLGDSLHPLKSLLLQRCLDSSTQMQIETLRLFEVLLDKPSEYIIHNLTISNLLTRGYMDKESPLPELCNDSEDESEEKSTPKSGTLSPKNIDKIITCFLEVFPEELRSIDDLNLETADGYKQYVEDGTVHFRSCLSSCSTFDWPLDAEFSEVPSSPDSESFYEGSFLNVIFNLLKNLLELPYELTLQVTSVISRLALLPHPYLHEYLLNPTIPTASGVRSLFSELHQLISHVQTKLKTVPFHMHKLQETRQQLLSDIPIESDVDDETARLLQAIIVLEEFCKELAAIAYVKYQYYR